MMVIIEMYEGDLGKIAEIAEKGLASGGYRQTTQHCIIKAFEEFIKKYLPKGE